MVKNACNTIGEPASGSHVLMLLAKNGINRFVAIMTLSEQSFVKILVQFFFWCFLIRPLACAKKKEYEKPSWSLSGCKVINVHPA